MIIVVGAGIAGSLTAYYLTRLGYEVLVIDQESAAAMACSHANAGIVAISHAQAWAKPSALKDISLALFGLSPSVKVSTLRDPDLITWGLAFLRECTPSRAERNSQMLARLSTYSATLIKDIEDEESLAYSQTHQGTLYLYQDEAELSQRFELLSRQHTQTRLLSPNDLAELHPALAGVQHRFAGGFHSPGDFTGDCCEFAQAINDISATRGATFQFDTRVRRLHLEDGRIRSIETDRGVYDCDHLVVAAGTGCPALLRPLGIKPLIYPVKGYSLTFPVNRPEMPQSMPGAIDETELVSFSRLGDRVRLTGFAEFAGHNLDHNDKHFGYLKNYAQALFGDDIDHDKPQYWTCLRPSTPSSLPYLGQCRHIDNLWLNAGHGQLGWTMSAGTGKLLAQSIHGDAPDIHRVSIKADWLNGI